MFGNLFIFFFSIHLRQFLSLSLSHTQGLRSNVQILETSKMAKNSWIQKGNPICVTPTIWPWHSQREREKKREREREIRIWREKGISENKCMCVCVRRERGGGTEQYIYTNTKYSSAIGGRLTDLAIEREQRAMMAAGHWFDCGRGGFE